MHAKIAQENHATVPALTVETITLPPMRVAAVRVFAREPEKLAWITLLAWAREHRFARDFTRHRFFGFNNPDPTPGRLEYGYEQWMTVGPAVRSSSGIQVKLFSGGRFLATRCDGLQQIMTCWQDLFRWCQHHPCTPEFERQYLEECLTPAATRPEEFVFQLLLPVHAADETATTSHAA
jgi:DNA gyrase inhibitor GyrI